MPRLVFSPSASPDEKPDFNHSLRSALGENTKRGGKANTVTNIIIKSDFLTGYPVEQGNWDFIPNGDMIVYYSKPSGVVRIIPDVAYERDKLKLAGLCRHFYERGEEVPFIIASSTFKNILEKYDSLIPKNFEQKKLKILEYLILKGGKEYREADIKFETDFTLVYGDKDELYRVLSSLRVEGLIEVKAPTKDGYGRVLPTKEGIKFVEGSPYEGINLANLLSKEEKEVAISLLELDELEKAFNIIKGLTDKKGTTSQKVSASLLLGDFYTVQKKKIRGTITQDNEMVEMAKLRERLLIALQ